MGAWVSSGVKTYAEANAIKIAVAIIAALSETAKTVELMSTRITKTPQIRKNRLIALATISG